MHSIAELELQSPTSAAMRSCSSWLGGGPSKSFSILRSQHLQRLIVGQDLDGCLVALVPGKAPAGAGAGGSSSTRGGSRIGGLDGGDGFRDTTRS